MNVKEFAALKVGDKVANLMSSSTGEVTEVTDAGVRVRWTQEGASQHGQQPVTFAYPVNSTAWFHWSKAIKCPYPEHADGVCRTAGCTDEQCLGGDYNAMAAKVGT